MKKNLLLSVTILGLISLGSVACIKRELIEPKLSEFRTTTIDHLERIKALFISSPQTVTVAWCGDSTSDLASNAISIVNNWNGYANSLGEPIYGFNPDSLLDFGVSGRKLSRWNSNHADAAGFNQLVAANPDAIIFSHGINDARINASTANQIKQMLVIAIDDLVVSLPNTDIIMRVPNCFLTTDPTGANYVSLTNPSGTITYYATLAIAAQAQTDSLYKAYTEAFAENTSRWDHVELFNAQDLIFGRICPATDPVLHGDQIHPTYIRIVEEVVKMVGNYPEYSQAKADSSYAIDSIAPYLHYNMALMDTSKFELIYEGTVSSMSTTKTDFNIPPSFALTGFHNGDIVSIGNAFFYIKTGTLSTVSATRTRLTQAFTPITGIPGAMMRIYRRK